MDDPVGALFGSLLVGTGSLLMYAAYKNKKVFGKDGLLPKALTTGSITSLNDVPKAYADFGLKRSDGPVAERPKDGEVGGVTAEVITAVDAIGAKNKSLGDAITNQLADVSETTNGAELAKLAGLLKMADGMQLTDQANVVRRYVKEKSGVSL